MAGSWCLSAAGGGTKAAMMSMGRGKMTVVLFSEEMLLRVWRYRSYCLVVSDGKMMTSST